ncbi:MAG: hypothetical protein LAN64_01450 [Acidobacteriia bacterium]|nr:hypothetical protein [Terriglobia bacterium]
MPKKITVNVNANKREKQNLSVDDIVEFQVNEECDLYFTNPDVFGTECVHLMPGKNPVKVQGDGATTWNTLTTSKVQAGKSPGVMGNPNEIVVP